MFGTGQDVVVLAMLTQTTWSGCDGAGVDTGAVVKMSWLWYVDTGNTPSQNVVLVLSEGKVLILWYQFGTKHINSLKVLNMQSVAGYTIRENWDDWSGNWTCKWPLRGTHYSRYSRSFRSFVIKLTTQDRFDFYGAGDVNTAPWGCLTCVSSGRRG